MALQTDIQDLGGLQRRLDLTVAASEVAQEVSQRLARIARQTKMPGFRPGKVPMKIVTASYGSQVQAEVMREKLGSALSSALDASKLRLAGAPRLEPRSVEDSGQIAFSATFEVYPDIDLGDVSKLELYRYTSAINEADVDRTVEIVRRQRAPRTAVERPAADGDRVTVDFRGTVDAQEFEGGVAKDFAFNLGEGRMLPEFERAVRGLRAGEQTQFPLTFPSDYPAPKIAGRDAQFEVKVLRVEAVELPAVDAQFARALGVADGDLTRMRAELRTNLEREVAARLRTRARDQVFEALLGATQFEVPQALVDDELQRLEHAAHAGARGDAASSALQQVARHRVRLGLLIGELVARNGLQPRQDQIRKAVESIAQSYENPSEVIHWYLGSRERLAEIEAGLTEDNVVNWALSRAKVSEVKVPFDELMGERK
ncbi:MAG TPA: trigger factor [Burkholderiaceae bacterium]|jgi:trigger factor|nr:trigger factor [Burkholderiaceae bacterium]